MSHNIALLMVTFARRDLFKQAIRSFIHYAAPHAVVVVDNNPAERLERTTLEALHGAATETSSIVLDGNPYRYDVWVLGNTKLYYVPSGENLGGAGGFRLGQSMAFALNMADYHYFTDDDVVVEADPFPPLIEVLASTDAPFASSLVFNEHLGDFELNQHKLSIDPLILAEQSVRSDHLSMKRIPIVANGFVGVLCRAKLCSRLGGVHAAYFVLYDDVDMTYRLSKAYGPGYLVPTSKIIHRFRAGSDYPSWKVALQLRNKVIFARRCFTPSARLRVTALALRAVIRLPGRSLRFKIRALCHLLSSAFGADRPFQPQDFRI